jgi:hypothetical protein
MGGNPFYLRNSLSIPHAAQKFKGQIIPINILYPMVKEKARGLLEGWRVGRVEDEG